jgi:hypothetical protein
MVHIYDDNFNNQIFFPDHENDQSVKMLEKEINQALQDREVPDSQFLDKLSENEMVSCEMN